MYLTMDWRKTSTTTRHFTASQTIPISDSENVLFLLLLKSRAGGRLLVSKSTTVDQLTGPGQNYIGFSFSKNFHNSKCLCFRQRTQKSYKQSYLSELSDDADDGGSNFNCLALTFDIVFLNIQRFLSFPSLN